MTDPYKTLGISPNATDEQVKSAYRDMARKYHPDNYQGNPLADLANDKMQEINQAYDQIMNTRRNDGGERQSYNYNYTADSAGGSRFADVRRLITSGRITQAEELLDGTPKHARDAEWHFLKGSIQYSRGWLEEALANFSRACSLDPANGEYRAALERLQWQGRTGRAAGYTAPPTYAGGCSICDICTAMYCASCCCDCMN